MMADIRIIIWKEWKEMLQFNSGKRSGPLSFLIMAAVFGIFMPIQYGKLWVESAASLGLWGVLPLILIGPLVADAIAGERERHTLETLLASRLSDQAILLGKICASIIYVWLVTQLVFIIALIPLNIIHGAGKLLIYSPKIAISGLVLSFLLSSLMSVIGVLISLRAESVKQAQQTLGVSIFVIAYLVPMAGIYALRFVDEEIRQRLFQPILAGDITTPSIWLALVLIIVNFILYQAAKARFQRDQLIII